MRFRKRKSNPPISLPPPPARATAAAVEPRAGGADAADGDATALNARPLGAEETDSPAPSVETAPSVEAPGVMPPEGTMVRPENSEARGSDAASCSRSDAARKPRRGRPGEEGSDIVRGRGHEGESLHKKQTKKGQD